MATETTTLSVPVYNTQGESLGAVELNADEFGGKINRQLLHEVVLMHLANQRLGTHSTKRRGEVAGSSRKLFRQKGTGNARRGTRRTNKVRGGGTSKGPKPRDYSYRLPKKAIRAALRMALLSKFQDSEALVLDELQVPEIKTKQIAALLKSLQLHDTTCLLGVPDYDVNLYMSARNIPNIEVLPVSQFHTYVVLRQKRLVLTRAALEILRQQGNQANGSGPSSNGDSQGEGSTSQEGTSQEGANQESTNQEGTEQQQPEASDNTD